MTTASAVLRVYPNPKRRIIQVSTGGGAFAAVDGAGHGLGRRPSRVRSAGRRPLPGLCRACTQTLPGGQAGSIRDP